MVDAQAVDHGYVDEDTRLKIKMRWESWHKAKLLTRMEPNAETSTPCQLSAASAIPLLPWLWHLVVCLRFS
jgi:hypothetical protein